MPLDDRKYLIGEWYMTAKEFAVSIGMSVGGGLDLSGTKITALPDNLSVGRWLDLSGTKITALPDNLSVGGGLDLRGTEITALPDNLSVGGGLYLSGTKITALPDNLSVGGGLDLRGMEITALPDNLSVGGWLDLRGTEITNVFYGSADRRGYQFFGAQLANGWRVLAGCRNYSPEEARSHWANNPECLALAEAVIAHSSADRAIAIPDQNQEG